MNKNSTEIAKIETLESKRFFVSRVFEQVSNHPTIIGNRIFIPFIGKGFQAVDKETFNSLYIVDEMLTDYCCNGKIFTQNPYSGQIKIYQLENGTLLSEFYSNVIIGVGVQHSNYIVSINKEKTSFVKLDLQKNEIVWQVPIPGERQPRTAFRTDGKRIIYTNYLSDIFCLDLETGDLLWEKKLSPMANPTTFNFKVGSLGIFNESLLLSVFDNFIVSLDLRTGDVNWEIETSFPQPYFKVYPDGMLYCFIGDMSKKTLEYRAIDCQNGITNISVYLQDQFKMIKTPFFVPLPAAYFVTNDEIYFTIRESRYFFGIDKLTGEICYEFENDFPFMGGDLVINDGRIFLLDESYRLLVIEDNKISPKSQFGTVL